MHAWQTLTIEDKDQVRLITLARPERRNALTHQMIAELTEAFLATDNDETILALILTGAGEAFCSGLDLAELQKMSTQTEAEQRADSDSIAAMFQALFACSQPTIAAVSGAAVAGGMGLATICDFTLAAPDARFGYPETKIGFIPALVSVFLIRQIGAKHARDLLLTGRLIDAREAHRLGLVTQICERQTAVEDARELATALLKNSPASLRATKRLLRELSNAQLENDLAKAAEANVAMRRTADFSEGLSAFLEKRKPAWSAVQNKL